MGGLPADVNKNKLPHTLRTNVTATRWTTNISVKGPFTIFAAYEWCERRARRRSERCRGSNVLKSETALTEVLGSPVSGKKVLAAETPPKGTRVQRARGNGQMAEVVRNTTGGLVDDARAAGAESMAENGVSRPVAQRRYGRCVLFSKTNEMRPIKGLCPRFVLVASPEITLFFTCHVIVSCHPCTCMIFVFVALFCFGLFGSLSSSQSSLGGSRVERSVLTRRDSTVANERKRRTVRRRKKNECEDVSPFSLSPPFSLTMRSKEMTH